MTETTPTMRTLYPLKGMPEGVTGWAMAQRLAAAEELPAAALDALQARHLRHVLTHHAAETPQFTARLARAGLAAKDLATPDALQQLPPLDRASLQAAGAHVYSNLMPFDHLPVRVTRTSGSTGEPVTLRRTRINGLLNAAATLRDHAWWNRPANGGRITMIRPQFARVAEVPAQPGSTTNVAQQIPITTDIHEQLRLIESFGPQTLLVYPGNLAALLEEWSNGAPVPTTLRHLKTIGETVSGALRARALATLGLPIEDTYSSEEFGMIATQCPSSGRYHVRAETHLVEVLDESGQRCAPGQTGRLVITDLHNLATPMIRYVIGDWAEAGAPCSCGRALPTLERILGRERNLVRFADGRRHWPLVGFQRFEQAVPVRQYQVIQHSFTDITLRVVTPEPLLPAQSAALSAIVREALEHPFLVTIEEHREALPPGPAGKREEFVCLIADGATQIAGNRA